MADCIFCAIASGEGTAKYVYQDDRAVAIEDLRPAAPTHVLVIPKEHMDTARELTDATLLGHLFTIAHRVAEDQGLAHSGYRLVLNIGPDGGQTVYHVHLHLLGGRPLGWPPG